MMVLNIIVYSLQYSWRDTFVAARGASSKERKNCAKVFSVNTFYDTFPVHFEFHIEWSQCLNGKKHCHR